LARRLTVSRQRGPLVSQPVIGVKSARHRRGVDKKGKKREEEAYIGVRTTLRKAESQVWVTKLKTKKGGSGGK